MYFQQYELNQKGNAYEVVLYIKSHHSLEEFAEEFGLTRKAEEDINRAAIGYVRKNFPTLRVKAIKVIMGGALVTTIMFGGNMTQAFAHEHETTTQTETTTETTTETNLATETETTVPDDEPVADEPSPTGETTDMSPTEEEPAVEPTPEEPVTEDEVPMDEPGLVPGDFFYFVEAVAEKIQLALTFDDTAKAELISQFANERIAEANALFEAGDTDGAIDLLNKALESQELALDYVTEEDETTPEEDLTSPEGELPPEEAAPTEDGNPLPNEEIAGDEPASEIRDKLQAQFSQNITALLLAMEKVENPNAKAALAKNVEKAFAKMEKKLGKIKNIEERIAGAIPVDEAVEDLLKDIREDQEDFESDMEEVEGEVTSAGVVPPVAPKAQKEAEKALAGQQKGQEKATQGKQMGQEKATKGKETGQEKQNEKRTNTPAPKNETKQENAGKGNANAGAKAGAGNKVNTETEINADVGVGKEATPKSNQERGNQGKGNGKNNE